MIPIRLAVVLALVVSAATARVLPGKELGVRGPLPSQPGTVGIYGGKNTTIQKHPYMVSVLLDGYAACAATILTNEWALTTAYCFLSQPANLFKVVANSPDGVHGTVYNLAKYKVHPHYDSLTMDYNYACVKIDGKFQWSKTTQPVRLPRKQPKLNTRFNVAGYGSYGQGLGWGLSEAWMTWSPKKLCVKHYGRYYKMTPRMGCGYGGGKSTLCAGDLADGFVKKGVIYGMFSFNDIGAPCNPSVPVVLSNVWPATLWIRKITQAKYEDE